MTDKYPHFENPFKVCSDEWCDRSFINSVIWCLEEDIESSLESIQHYHDQIEEYTTKYSCVPPIVEQLKEWQCRKENQYWLDRKKLELLKCEGISDKEKIGRYREIKKRGY